MVYDESDTDMLVAMPLPLTDLYHDGLSPWETCAELASRDPDRTIFWGSVNPLEGRKALDLMERQVGEFGALALPFVDETCWQLIRYPNLYASLAATINFLVRAPRMFAEILGKLLFWCGEDKIIYGSGAPIFHPQWALRAFKDFQIPEDLCAGYGYPQLTEQAKRKILGKNLLRLHGLDVADARARLGRTRS